MLHIGYQHRLVKDRILGIYEYKGASMKRLREDKINVDKYIDCTSGRTTRSLILLDDGTVMSSAISTVRLQGRMLG